MVSFHSPVEYQPDQSFTSLEYTYSDSKYSCISWVYPLHIIFAYLVVLSGLLALISRVVSKLTPYHHMFGVWYLIFMFWCMATSLLIHNSGLPLPIIVSFLYLLVSITIGLNAIKAYTSRISQEVVVSVNKKISQLILKNQLPQTFNLRKIQQEERTNILRQKTFLQRICSLKMAHAFFFTFSWAQMLGRTMVTNPFNSFSGCWTYPSYKTIAMSQTSIPIDSVSNPPFPMQTSTFVIMITIPTVVIISLIAFLTTYCYYRSDSKAKQIANVNGNGNNQANTLQQL